MELFSIENKEFINNLIEKKLPILRQDTNFNEKYIRLNDAMEELEETLSDNQKDLFNEIVQLFYQTEEYYFILSYSLGVKYGSDLEKL